MAKRKMTHYKLLLASLSGLAGNAKNMRGHMINLLFHCLVAPQAVVTALMDFHDEVKYTNQKKSKEKHDKL